MPSPGASTPAHPGQRLQPSDRPPLRQVCRGGMLSFNDVPTSPEAAGPARPALDLGVLVEDTAARRIAAAGVEHLPGRPRPGSGAPGSSTWRRQSSATRRPTRLRSTLSTTSQPTPRCNSACAITRHRHRPVRRWIVLSRPFRLRVSPANTHGLRPDHRASRELRGLLWSRFVGPSSLVAASPSRWRLPALRWQPVAVQYRGLARLNSGLARLQTPLRASLEALPGDPTIFVGHRRTTFDCPDWFRWTASYGLACRSCWPMAFPELERPACRRCATGPKC